ncbi:MAG: DUF2232 domain-containing protein [Rhodospirillaceae bacterium]|nr:DUF2232 domain-containing protein [Rhodospirillaceae bacterium]
MTRNSTIAVVAGALGALLLVAALRQSMLGVMVGAMLSPLPLVMVTFGLGSAFLPLAVVAGAVTVTVVTGSIPLATVFLAVDAAPVALLSRLNLAAMAAAGRPLAGLVLGRTVCWLVLVAGAAMVAGLAMMAAGPDGIEATLRQQIDKVLAAVPVTAPATGGETTTAATPRSIDLAAARTEMVKAVAGLLPGLAAWDWCLRAILSAGLAQLMLTRMNLALWPTPAYRGFEAPQWYFALFGVTAMAAAVLKDDAGFIAGNAAAILSLPLVLQGLAVVHSAARLVKYRLVWLATFYVLALATADLSAVLLVGLGVMDQFLQIRGRYLAPRTGGE